MRVVEREISDEINQRQTSSLMGTSRLAVWVWVEMTMGRRVFDKDVLVQSPKNPLNPISVPVDCKLR